MAISDGQFRVGAIVAGIVLALGIAGVRFCGSVSLPAKPSAIAATSAREPGDLRTTSATSPAIYLDFLARDAAAAGLAKPTLEEISRKLPYRVDEGRHVLEVGQRPIELAGLKLSAVRAGDSIALELRNTTQSALAYLVISEPAPNAAGCNSARPLPLNAMVIGKQDHETRVECVWRDEVAIAVTRIETIELPPLSAWYVAQVPPSVVGIEDRVARGHRAPASGEKCSPMVGQAIKTGLERGEIGWRDLVDFYARHRCQTYDFPLLYKAFTRDGQHPLPATAAEG